MVFRLFLYLVIVISAVFHEFMHGWTADQLGDPTAKHAGRLTLNPLKHMDLIGTFLLPLLLMFSGGGFIGWAKPVPYNPHNLSDQKFGSTKVALAGPLANIIIAVLFGLVVRILPFPPVLLAAFSWIIYINLSLAFFNLIPLPPLDGSKLLLDLFPRSAESLLRLSYFGIFLALLFAFYVVSPLAGWSYQLIVGGPFLPMRPF